MEYVDNFKQLQKEYVAEIIRIQESDTSSALKQSAMSDLRRWYDRQYDYLMAHGEQV